jgi:hypothetical protein
VSALAGEAADWGQEDEPSHEELELMERWSCGDLTDFQLDAELARLGPTPIGC